MRKHLVRSLFFVGIVGLGAFVASSMPWTPTAEELGLAGFGLAVVVGGAVIVYLIGAASGRVAKWLVFRLVAWRRRVRTQDEKDLL